jgi:uncharacterized RDD family membrane protein YckC
VTAPDHAPSRPADPLQGHAAGLVSRFAAAAIDLGVILILLAATYGAVAGFAFIVDPRSFTWPDGLGWSIPVVGIVIATPYLAISWCASGRTVGGSLLGLRVLSYRGQTMRLAGAVVRAFGCLVFPLGLLWIPFSPKRRSLQDVILRTSVIYDWAHRDRLNR